MAVWRIAASLILVARHGQKSSMSYDLLCLKRHQASRFMPKYYVFPGGNIDPADSNLKWYELFAKFHFDNDSFMSLVPKTAVRPQIFKSQPNELPKEISLRITAIRETFEECGVLMCKVDREFSAWAQPLSVPKKELQTWQSKIRNDAAEFLTFCEKFKCYPDLWTLHEWSNWLTPVYFPNRYNTVFFLACVQNVPHAEYDAMEIEDLKWDKPENFWSSLDIKLPPPQQYEISMLAKFKSIDHLLDYAVRRGKAGTSLYFPIRINLKDGIVHVLPGDTMYPKEVDPTEKLIIDKSNMSMDEFREMTQVKDRMESLDARMTIYQLDAESMLQKDLQIKQKY